MAEHPTIEVALKVQEMGLFRRRRSKAEAPRTGRGKTAHHRAAGPEQQAPRKAMTSRWTNILRPTRTLARAFRLPPARGTIRGRGTRTE